MDIYCKGIAKRCHRLLQLSFFADRAEFEEGFPSRPYLREFRAEAAGIEEILDAGGARKSRRWYPFREAVAAIKTFTGTHYNLLHIYNVAPDYSLLEIEGDFQSSMENALDQLKGTIANSSRSLLEQAKRCGVLNGEESVLDDPLYESEPLFKFEPDRTALPMEHPGKEVVYLATKFLNLAEAESIRDVLTLRHSERYEKYIPCKVSEEVLRSAESQFHNLQSLYDTNVFGSDLESVDKKLVVLRGHVSVIYHLLEIATSLAHYYERHMEATGSLTADEFHFPIERSVLLHLLFEFVLNYSARYLYAAVQFCREMIQDYSEEGEVVVPIPVYRGFHVRPSTLIAKIVGHYGSSIEMLFDGQHYNAGSSLDLFRANEAINAYKRRQITRGINTVSHKYSDSFGYSGEISEKLKSLFLELMDKNEIILYDTQLSFEELPFDDDETLAERASRYIKHYMSLSKLDVRSDLNVVFRGDIRVLKDLRILAENGYGEDREGNNIPLPKELNYLQRT